MPLISAESEWIDVYDHAHGLLDRHEEARALIDEASRRADVAMRTCGDLHLRSWLEIEKWARKSRPVRDYRAAVLKAARLLMLGEIRAEVVHELVGRGAYELARPRGKVGQPAPAPAVGSAAAADLTGLSTWRSGATANQQSRGLYLRTTASKPDRPAKFNFDKESL